MKRKSLLIALICLMAMPLMLLFTACDIDSKSVKLNVETNSVALVVNEFVYDGQEKTVEINENTLPENVAVKEISGTTSATDAGEYTVTISLEVSEELASQYNEIPQVELTWVIKKANIPQSTINGIVLEQTSFVYNGGEQTVNVKQSSLPNGVTVKSVTGNTRTIARNDYKCLIELELSEELSRNYNPVAPIERTWAIEKANVEFNSEDIALVSDNLVYNGSEQTVTVDATTLPTNIKVNRITSNVARNVGMYKAHVQVYYDVADYENYNTIPSFDIDWQITKADLNIDLSQIELEQNSFVYDGSQKVVAVDDTTMPANVTVVSITNGTATNVGKYYAEVLLNFDDNNSINYDLKMVVVLDYEITKADLATALNGIALTNSELTYNGSEQTVTINNATLPANVVVANIVGNTATNAGTYKAIVTLNYTGADKDNYNALGTIELTYVINKANLDIDLTNVTLVDDALIYNGNAQSVSVNIATLPTNISVVSISGNTATNVGNYTATITLAYVGADASNYNALGSITRNYAIGKADNNIDLSGIALTNSELTYNGSEQTVTVNNETLPANVVVSEITGNSATTVGNYVATVTLTYTGADAANYNALAPIQLAYSISKANLNIDLSGIALTTSELTYNGSEQTVTVNNATLPANVVVSGITGNTSTTVGNYTATVTLTYTGADKDNYNTLAPIQLAYSIAKANLEIDLTGITLVNNALTYNGNEQTVTVNLGSLPTNISVVSISGNTATNVGNYTATITLAYVGADASNYNALGSITRNYAIGKADNNIDLSGIALTNSELTYNGSEQTVTVNNETLPANVVVSEITGNTATTIGNYVATVTLTYTGADAANYNALGQISLNYVIVKAISSIDVNEIELTTNELTYNGSEQTVTVNNETLPANVVVANIVGNKATNVGNYVAFVTLEYSGSDAANYHELGTIELPYTISKANLVIDLTGITLVNNALTYNGNVQSVTVDLGSLPVNVSVVSISGNTATNVGNYTATITLAYVGADASNYNALGSITRNYAIGKADNNIDLSGIALTNSELTYNGSEQTVTVNNETLPANVVVSEITGNTQTNAGNYTATVTLTYTGADAANYNALTPIQLAYSIAKANKVIDLTGIALINNELAYNATIQNVSVDETTLPENVEVVSVTGNSATHVGNYTAIVTLTYTGSDRANYNELESINLSWSIVAGDYEVDLSAIRLEENVFYYDRTAHTATIDEDSVPANVTVISITDNVQTNAGIYYAVVTVSYDDGTNIDQNTTATISLTWTVMKGDIVVRVRDKEIVEGNHIEAPYGSKVNELMVTGLISGDYASSVIKGDYIYDLGDYDKDTCQAGDTFFVTVSGLYADNYDIEFIGGTLTILEAKITETTTSGTTNLNSFGSSINKSATYTLLDDVTISWLSIGGTFDNALQVVLDLNGHTLYGSKETTNNPFIQLRANKNHNVTVRNGTIAIQDYYAAFKIQGTNTVNLENTVTITTVGDAIAIFGNGATLNTCATIHSQGDYAIVGNGTDSSSYYGTTINVTGGEITSQDTAIYHPQDGVLNISGGTIVGVSTAVEVRAGTVTISGGTLTSTASTFTKAANGNGTTMSGTALGISQHTTNKDISVTITAGVFNGVYAVYEEDLQDTTATDRIEITISGGTFNGDIYSENVTEFITGGTFEYAVSTSYYAPVTATTYEITFVNLDGTVLEVINTNENEAPVYPLANPTWASFNNNDTTIPVEVTFAFAGWEVGGTIYSGALPVVTEAKTYKAVYTASLNGSELTGAVITCEVTGDTTVTNIITEDVEITYTIVKDGGVITSEQIRYYDVGEGEEYVWPE